MSEYIESWDTVIEGEKIVNEQKVKSRKYTHITAHDSRRWNSERAAKELRRFMPHVISDVDIDSLTFLRFIIKAEALDHVVISSWCMSCHDILEIETYIKNSRIKKIEWYVGEIFKNSYSNEYEELKKYSGNNACMGRGSAQHKQGKPRYFRAYYPSE